MTEYALLISPSANRVYAEAAAALTRAELAVVSERMLGGALAEVRPERMGSVEYLVFRAERLGERELVALSNLSTTFALFERADGRLTPLELHRLDRFDSDLLTIQRYAGKTNESFTKLLLNVTLASSDFAGQLGERTFAVLDPLCGRGTTLDQALMYGFDAAGVELDRRDFDAYAAFIQRWVKDKRLKHHAHLGHVKGHPRLALDIGLDRESFKAGKALHLAVVNASTLETTAVFPPRSFDLIVTDAPYGVQHGSTGERASSRGARWSWWPRPPRSGARRCGRAGPWGSPGTCTWHGARRWPRRWRRPAWRCATARPTAASSTGWIRRS